MPQIHYIIIRMKWKNSLLNAELYNFSSIGSDHRIVSSRIRLSLQANGKILPKHEKLD